GWASPALLFLHGIYRRHRLSSPRQPATRYDPNMAILSCSQLKAKPIASVSAPVSPVLSGRDQVSATSLNANLATAYGSRCRREYNAIMANAWLVSVFKSCADGRRDLAPEIGRAH